MKTTRSTRSRPGRARSLVVLFLFALSLVTVSVLPVAAQDEASPAPTPTAAEAACDSASDLQLIIGFVIDSVEDEAGLLPVGIGVIAGIGEARDLLALVGETYRPLVEDLIISLQDLRDTIGELDELDTAGAKLAVIGEEITQIGLAMDSLATQLRTRCPEA